MKRLFFLLLLLTSVAWAEPTEFEMKLPANLNTQLEINMWAQDEFERVDKELNQVWNELLPKLSEKEKHKLTDAQLLWIKFRDAQAESDALAYEGGSIVPYIVSESKVTSTKLRTWQLRLRLDELIRLGN